MAVFSIDAADLDRVAQLGPTGMRLLLVEDNQRLQGLLAETINSAGYGLDAVGTVADLYASVAATPYDLVVIDLGLPDGDGIAAIRKLRSERHSMPILVVTARGAIDDRVHRPTPPPRAPARNASRCIPPWWGWRG